MLEAAIEKHLKWRERAVLKAKPHLGWDVHPVFIRHGRNATGPAYPAVAYMPQSWLPDQDLGLHLNPLPAEGGGERSLPKGGIWVTVHSGADDQMPGARAYVMPEQQGLWRIHTGHDGGLDGARMTHVKSASEYRALKRQARQEGEGAL